MRKLTIITITLILAALAGFDLAHAQENPILPPLDMNNFSVFALIFLIPGIVETCKKFGVTGNASLVLSIALGVFFVALGEAINQGLITGATLVWLRILVVALTGGLAASGYYDLLFKPVRDRLNRD